MFIVLCAKTVSEARFDATIGIKLLQIPLITCNDSFKELHTFFFFIKLSHALKKSGVVYFQYIVRYMFVVLQ